MHQHASAAASAAAAAIAVLLLLLATPGSANITDSAEVLVTDNLIGDGLDVYTVLLDERPVAAYGGGTTGYEATQVEQASTSDGTVAQKLDVNSAAVVAYAAYLDAQSASVAATANVDAANVIYFFKYVVAGFAVRVKSAKQLAALRRDRRVSFVERVQWVHAHTFGTPGFLGLDGNSSTGSGGAWGNLGGASHAGEDVSICVLDTGIEPEHPSFSDRQDARSNTGPLAYTEAKNAFYQGSCPVGEEFPAGTCNRKLIGCQAFSKGFVAASGEIPDGDVNSCRDGNMHGTHVAATAGGNRVDISGKGDLVISGMAPRARLAMYKV
eukprot:GHRQ01010005.1.p1 GENE.GHRQ01010005.1~~GHRQ01010005.1.p1  ORF type:complete len:337 (+),score=80.91 GHRQ01010005.1:38-1012(+)